MNDQPFRSRSADRSKATERPTSTEPAKSAKRPESSDRKVITALLLGLVLLLGGLYVAGYLFTSDKLPTGTTIAGVKVGGLKPVAAERELVEGLGARTQEPIIVSAAGQRHRIEPLDAGLGLDVAGSVAQAGAGRSWSPARMWGYFTGGDDFDAVVTVDGTKLEAQVAAFAKKVDQKARNGAVTFETGTATPRLPYNGQAIDQDSAVDEILDAYLQTTEVVPLPVTDVEPEISEKEVRTAMDDFANPAMSAPVIIVLAGENVVLRPEAYSPAISLVAKDGALVPALDEKALLKAIKQAVRTVALQPREATVKLVDGRPVVVPGRTGLTFERKKLIDRFLKLVVKKGNRRTIAVQSVIDTPDFTAADARKLQITEMVSSYSIAYPHADYRNTNLGRAAELISGTVLKPGETFSLNNTVGERTRANGFTEGFIISDGVYLEELGGGVSQMATTLFNAMFFAGLEDVEHKPHSFYIDRYPVGREATVVWGAVDLQFKNDTPYGVLISTSISPSSTSSDGAVNVSMWSTKYWDITAGVSDRYDITEEKTRRLKGDDCVPNDGYGGFDINVFRYFRQVGSDELVRKETMNTTYTPSDTVICTS